MDMLVKLYALPKSPARLPPGLVIRKPLAFEHRVVIAWIEQQFGPAWASEAEAALHGRPAGNLFVAQRDAHLLAFCAYDATARGMVGPIGVAEGERGKGLGSALLLACLHDMRSAGYAYAVAGAVGSTSFFARAAGAVAIEGSTPGLYAGRLA